MPPTAKNRLPEDVQDLLSGLRCVQVAHVWIAILVLAAWSATIGLRLTTATAPQWQREAVPAVVQTLGGWSSWPLLPMAGKRLIGVGLAAVLIIGLLLNIYGKITLLGGIDDAPTRGLVWRSLLCDLLGWPLAFLAHYLAAQSLSSPLDQAPLGVAIVARLLVIAGLLPLAAFLIKAAHTLSHDELQTQATGLRGWLIRFLFFFVVSIAVAFAWAFPWPKPLSAQAARIVGYVAAAAITLAALWGALLLFRLAALAARTRRALQLWAEAQATPVPNEWV